jgi:hypothetical protein
MSICAKPGGAEDAACPKERAGMLCEMRIYTIRPGASAQPTRASRDRYTAFHHRTDIDLLLPAGFSPLK